MAQIKVHFYHSLNNFIAPALSATEIIHNFDRKASVKDMIESFNVPHPEVELILVNGIAVNFNYIAADGGPEVKPLLPLRSELPRPPVFVVDSNLGKLARYLRLLGFDCLYRNDFGDATVATIASEQQRIVLTRDRSLLQRRIITYGYFVRANLPKIQTQKVLKRFNLYSLIKPLTRCTHCNGKLMETGKQQIEHCLEPLTRKYYEKFLVCPECGQIYWQGGHYVRIKLLIDEFAAENYSSV